MNHSKMKLKLRRLKFSQNGAKGRQINYCQKYCCVRWTNLYLGSINISKSNLELSVKGHKLHIFQVDYQYNQILIYEDRLLFYCLSVTF